MNRKNIMIVIILIILIVIGFITFKSFSKGIGSAGISLEEFKKISTGMDNFEVNSIIDNEDLWNNDDIYEKACIEINKEKEGSIYSYTNKYIGEKSGYALITFSVDYSSDNSLNLKFPEVIKKENHNLK